MVESGNHSMDLKAFLKEVTAISGTPGYEKPVAEYIAKVFEPLCDEVTLDHLYDVIAVNGKKEGERRPRFIICAHQDEIGMVVTDIEDDGCVRITRTGGVDPRILPAMEVNILTKEGPLYGVVGAKAPHLLSEAEKNQSIQFPTLYIDVGMSAEEVRRRVRVGDQVIMLGKTVELADGCMAGKTMDDRACVGAMMECAKNLSYMNVPAEVYMVATTKEEVGGWGASATTYNLEPDVAIVVDVTHGEGPGTGKFEAFPLNKPTISMGPNLHPMLTKKLREIAKKHRIDYALEVTGGGTTGTDASSTNISRGGLPSVLISVPLKYMHTTVEMLSVETLREVGRLMALFISEITREWEELKWF